jgi:hypothetical protein
MQTFATLHTNGRGYWSRKATAVSITKMDLQYINNERTFGELCVYFNTDPDELGASVWDVNTDGLIYTDKQFMSELRAYLQTIGFSEAEANDVNYSEQGMQSDNYVSCDVAALFITALEKLDPQHVAAVAAECADV